MPIQLTPEEIRKYHLRPNGKNGSLGIRQEFSSMTQLIKYLDTVPGYLDHKSGGKPATSWGEPGFRYSRANDGYYSDWTGCKDWPSTRAMALKGWPEARGTIRKLSGRIYSKLGKQVFKPTLRLAEEGDHGFCVATMLSGDPEFVLQQTENPDKRSRGRGRIVKIVASVDACGGVGKERMFRRGASMVSVAMALEQAGYRTEIIATVASPGRDPQTGGRIYFHNSFRVKEPSHPVNVDVLAFALCNASVLRRIWFGAWETLPGRIRQPFGMGNDEGYNYGAPCESDITGDINLPQASFYHECWRSDQATEEWCLKELEKQGVIIK